LACGSDIASGFSHSTCFFAFSAAIAISKWLSFGVATSTTWIDGLRVELPQLDGIDFAKLSRDLLDGTTPTPEPRDPAVARIEQLHRQHARLLAELAAVGEALREATAPKP
jgi:hypothetical protein